MRTTPGALHYDGANGAPLPTGPDDGPPAALAEALAEAVCVLDADGRVQYVNAAAEELLGCSRRRILGAPLDDAVGVDPEWLRQVTAAVGSDCGFTVREVGLTPPHAESPRLVDASVTPWLPPAGGSPLAVIELVPVDRHLRIAREESLRAQEEASRRLLRGVAHEIRNPLAGLRGAAQLLERELSEPALREYTGVIVREVDRMRDLVERMVGPVGPPRRARLNLHEITEHVVQLLRAEAAPGVAIATEYDPSIPELGADRDQLVQALLNLGRNALQAVGGHGTVAVRTRTLRQYTVRHVRHRLVAVIEVADDGPGVPPELLETLFQPMVSGRAEGSGLGLTIAQSLVGRHGGLIECDSTAEGTVFRMLVPLEAPDG
ncbi:MAG: nitrogen regulation protein NR(II) [Halofilum sp. (in: g-proteobacteria)]|nr:nitrogen regulation protein NR(II) [Halofilum sp. (in: g-proteobacteria)]